MHASVVRAPRHHTDVADVADNADNADNGSASSSSSSASPPTPGGGMVSLSDCAAPPAPNDAVLGGFAVIYVGGAVPSAHVHVTAFQSLVKLAHNSQTV